MVDGWLDQYPEARGVIFDVFTRVRGHGNDRTSQYVADYEAMAQIKAVVDAHAVAGLVVHHTRKAASEDFLDAVSGTQGIAGAADAVLILKRSRGSASATLEVTGRDIEEVTHALDYDASIGTWTLLAGEAGDYELAQTRRRILEAVRRYGALTPSKLAELVGMTQDNAKQTVRRMAIDGQLDTDGSGRYWEPLSPVTPVTESPTSDSGDSGGRDEG